ncbi:MAG TPA: BT_3928 family protein [Chitinophagaceae bacterium]
MKAVVNLVRIIVGVLFIFSGLVKAIDPLGLSYKMQEFFELWHMQQFNSWTLLFSILMNAFEIIAGFALLLGWRIRLFSWLLLLLILFFTFLTGYAYLSGKFKNCGCFGDCIPITPLTSFAKDIVLTILIGFLFWNRNKIKPLFSEKASTWLMLLITALSFGLQWYSLTYLPPVDCLPYKKGKNISEQMKMPANAVPDSTVITFVYEKDGKQVEFTADKFPADFGDAYKFVSRYDKIVKKGKNNEPPIKGFVLTDVSDADSTKIILDKPYAVLVFVENFKVPVSKWENDFEQLYAEAKAKNIPVYFITGNMNEATGKLKGTSFANIPLLKCDFTAIRTAARTSPTIYLLNTGTIIDKKSYKNTDDITDALKSLPVQKLPEPIIQPPIIDTATINHKQ